jgi:hypothetical protein
MSRPKGSKNKAGAEVKAQILACYERLGSLAAFTEWAKENPTDFYRMYANLAPKELTADVHVTSEVELTDEQLAAIATGSSTGASEAQGSSEEPAPVH